MKYIIMIGISMLLLAACGETQSSVEDAYSKGFQAGQTKGYNEGLEEGREDGYQKGYMQGLQEAEELMSAK